MRQALETRNSGEHEEVFSRISPRRIVYGLWCCRKECALSDSVTYYLVTVKYEYSVLLQYTAGDQRISV